MGGTQLKTFEAPLQVIGSSEGVIADDTSTFFGIYGGVFETVEADSSISAPHSGVLKLIRGKSTVNTLDVALTTSLRIGGVTQSGGAVIAASTVEESDSTLEVAFAKGDVINFIAVAPVGTGTVTFHFAAEIKWNDD